MIKAICCRVLEYLESLTFQMIKAKEEIYSLPPDSLCSSTLTFRDHHCLWNCPLQEFWLLPRPLEGPEDRAHVFISNEAVYQMRMSKFIYLYGVEDLGFLRLGGLTFSGGVVGTLVLGVIPTALAEPPEIKLT